MKLKQNIIDLYVLNDQAPFSSHATSRVRNWAKKNRYVSNNPEPGHSFSKVFLLHIAIKKLAIANKQLEFNIRNILGSSGVPNLKVIQFF